MSRIVKIIIVLLPVMLLAGYSLNENYRDAYRHVGSKKIFLFIIPGLLMSGWMISFVLRRSQDKIWQVVIQSSFLVYSFMVLTLTGYFILFREIGYHDWWQQMLERVEKRDHVNLQLFKIFSIYRITDKQIVGNLVMLFPLGIYLPLLYKRITAFLQVILVGLVVSISIELLQLVTSFRSVDIDDILLNTIGVGAGYVFYKIMMSLTRSKERYT